MPFWKKFAALFAPAMLLMLSACATGFPAQVSRFQALPAPQGQSFVIQAADPKDRGGLEFSHYADLVRRHLLAQGYAEAPSPQAATLIVSLEYGVDDGRQQVRSTPGFGGYGGFGYSPWGFHRPYYSRFGYGRGFRSPFYYGWDDPFWGAGYDDIDVYTVFTSFLDMDIKRAADGQSVFEGTAKARSRSDDLQLLVPNLVEAMFTGFPGNSGEQIRITVPPPPRAR
ncbi:MAG: DUF4136 domain-containing protein [Alphaproteobacteria bacterium]|nr:MAG: DUF4136 domain-containing protein [Alphaproteobacteria bacterium]